MGESVIKKILKKICVCNGFSYAIFWGFHHKNPMLLTSEDSYYEEKFGSAIHNLLQKVQMLGEGAIGEAAFTGKHQWICIEDHNSEFNSFRSIESQNKFQDESEVLDQFYSGIKTIVVIPIELRGVVQFGSTEKILESLEFVDQTVRLFQENENLGVLGNSNPMGKVESFDINALFSSLISTPNDNCNELRRSGRSATSSNQPSPSTSGVVHHRNSVISNVNSGYLDEIPSQFDKASCFSTWSCEYQALVPESMLQESSDFSSFYSEKPMESQQSLPSIFDELFEDFKPDDFFNLCQGDDFSQFFASTPNQGNVPSSDLTHLVASSSTPSNLVGVDTKIEDPDSFAQEKSVIIQSKDKFGQTGESWEDIMMPLVNTCSSSASGKCAPGARKGLFSELGLEELLAGSNSSSCLTNSVADPQSWPAKRRRIESAGSSGNTGLLHNDMKKEIPKSQVSLWIDDSYSLTAASAVPSSQTQRAEEQKRVIRKRARPGESTRPRPKDRQLIQDRIKELRGIIPNGGKCSIDSLLDRTIKYMIFLQGVTKHADKLKQSNKPKLIGNENGAVFRNKNGTSSSGGATWAFEVGTQSMVCPIIVEDLSPPGQMLIEMLCEEQGFFLEIADIVRGFGLSILKGAMEVREGKIWAHFIVEAKSHITRIEVLWSLVRLLQQTNTSLIDSTNVPSNVVLDGEVPLMDTYQKPNLLTPICLAEAFR